MGQDKTIPPVGAEWQSGFVRDMGDGTLLVKVGSSVTLTTSDIEIGGVELKDGATDNRASISAAGAVKVDGSAVTQPVSFAGGVDVTDRIARLLGQAKLLDSSGAVIDPATKQQLPAALDGDGGVKVHVQNSPAAGLTDAQLRASAVPVSLGVALPAGANNIGDVDVLTVPADPFGANADAVVAAGAAGSIQAKLRRTTQGLEDLKTSIALAASTAAIGKLAANSGVDIGDVDVTSLPSIPPLTDGTQKAINRGGAKGATTAADVTSTAEGADHQALDNQNYHGGVAIDPRDMSDRAARVVGVVTPPAITKGAQGASGFTTQDLKDAGRNLLTYFMVVPILTTAAEVMMSLTGYKSGAAVAATATPAVVTAGKTLRITAMTITYVATATAGLAKFTLRVNTGGVAVIGSPLLMAHVVGTGTPATAGSSQTESVPIPDGLELPAGAGLAVGLQGLSAVMAGAIAGYGKCALYGYEY